MINANLFRQHFSLQNNFRTLFIAPTTPRFTHIDGLRAIAIIWMISFHTIWGMGYFYPVDDFVTFIAQPQISWMMQGHMGVDIFFVISGFLIGHILLSEIKRTGHLQLKPFYIKRAFRILPAYFFIMLIIALVAPENLENIWANILYVNNFLSITDQFMGWAWSLAIEEQFYTLCPLLLIFLYRNTRQMLLILVALFIFSFIIRWILFSTYHFTAPIAVHPALDETSFVTFFDAIYDKLYTRYGGLLIGVIAAYLSLFTSTIHWLETQMIWRRFLLGLSSSVIALLILFPTLKANELNSTWFSLFTISYRNLFSLAIAYWVIYCMTIPGKLTVINRCLSSHFWYPIAQLSYSAYLVHLAVIMGIGQMLYNTITIPNILQGFIIVAFFIIFTLLISIIPYLLIEKPFMNMRRSL